MADDRASIDPIFIMGVGRSGTTLLVNLLGGHPLLAPVYETPFLRKIIRHCERASRASSSYMFRSLPWLIHRFLKSDLGKLQKRLLQAAEHLPDPSTIKQEYEQFPFGLSHCILYTREDVARETDVWLRTLLAGPITEQEIYRSARQFVDRLFSIHCSRLNKASWVNKTPALLNYVDRLPKLYPSARCVHILRDGRDTAASLLSLPWGPETMAAAARHWKAHLVHGRRKLFESKLLFIELRYEDLVASPKTTLQRIFSFLNMEANPSKIVENLPVYKTKMHSWKTALSAQDKIIFNREAGDLLIELGYERDTSWAR